MIPQMIEAMGTRCDGSGGNGIDISSRSGIRNNTSGEPIDARIFPR